MGKDEKTDIIEIDCDKTEWIDKVQHIISENKNEIKKYTLTIDTSKYSKNENFLKLSRKYEIFRDVLNKMTNNGYYMTDFIDGISIFEKYNSLEYLKIFKKECNKCKSMYNLIYEIETPLVECEENFLLIIFSSFQIYPYLPSSSYERYFLHDFPSIKKYIPENVYILRIADIGGVSGSFYLNTNFDDLIESNIEKLIAYTRKEHKIHKNNTLLFGYSKGATAAFYYGIKNRYKALSVDPILSDEYHIEAYNDSHFTCNIFPRSKQLTFANLLDEKNNLHKDLYMITSKKSQQYKYIKSFIDEYDDKRYINTVLSNHPSINAHVDVGQNTKNLAIMLINTMFYKINRKKSFEVEC